MLSLSVALCALCRPGPLTRRRSNCLTVSNAISRHLTVSNAQNFHDPNGSVGSLRAPPSREVAYKLFNCDCLFLEMNARGEFRLRAAARVYLAADVANTLARPKAA